MINVMIVILMSFERSFRGKPCGGAVAAIMLDQKEGRTCRIEERKDLLVLGTLPGGQTSSTECVIQAERGCMK